MYCITRSDMKFGNYFVPARTKGKIINTPMYREANIPGLQLYVSISLFDIHPNRQTGVPIAEIEINNELEKASFRSTKSQMQGIVIYTHGDQVYIDAEDPFYTRATLSKWGVEKIFGETIPDGVIKADYSNDYSLKSVLECLENEFTQWVENNCDFKTLSEEDIENGEGFDGSYPGDKMLSDLGLSQFKEKKLEYQKRLETSGFTYDFKGGLIWE